MTEKFEFIDAEYAAYQESDDEHVPSIVKMCVWMEVSRSGFYEWRNAPESATAKRRGILALYVQKSFGDSDDTYGYRRVHADLVAWGVPAGPELVRSVMRELGLEPCQPRPWRVSLTEGDGQEHDIPIWWPGISLLTRPARNGRRHHVHLDLGGLAFPGHRYRLPYKGGDRVGHGR